MMARCSDELGSPDILVNNAGIQYVSPVEDFPPAKWDAIIAINLTAVFHTTRLALPGNEARKDGAGSSTPLSAHSLVASPNKSPMSPPSMASPASPRRSRWRPRRDGITVNCISPGYVWTPLVEGQIPDTMKARGLTREQVINDVLLAAQPTKRFVTPDEVAALRSSCAATRRAVDHRRQPQHGRRLDRRLARATLTRAASPTRYASARCAPTVTALASQRLRPVDRAATGRRRGGPQQSPTGVARAPMAIAIGCAIWRPQCVCGVDWRKAPKRWPPNRRTSAAEREAPARSRCGDRRAPHSRRRLSLPASSSARKSAGLLDYVAYPAFDCRSAEERGVQSSPS